MTARLVVPSGTGDTLAFTGSTQLHGYSVRESAGTPAAATVFIKDGLTAGGPLVAMIELGANQSQTVWLPSVNIATGLVFETALGESEGVLYVS